MKNFYIAGVLLLLLGLAGCRMENLQDALSLAERHSGTLDSLIQVTQTFTPQEEHYLGKAVAAQILSRYPALNDQKANNYLNQIGQALALCSSQPYTYGGYHFLLLDSNEVNAFAAPDGLIFVTKGMLRLVGNESQLAAVLAHEIAHVQHKDALNAINNARLTSVFSSIGIDAARQYTPAQASQLINAFSDSVNEVVETLITKGYARSQEYDADADACEILARAGYDPQGLSQVLKTMASQVPTGSTGLGSTHPSADDRLAKLPDAGDPAAVEPAARQVRFQAAMGSHL